MEGLFCAQEEDVLRVCLTTDKSLDYLVKGTQDLLRDKFPARAKSYLDTKFEASRYPTRPPNPRPTIKAQLHAQPITKRFVGRRTQFFRTFAPCSKAQMRNEKKRAVRTPIRGFPTQPNHRKNNKTPELTMFRTVTAKARP